MWSAGTVAANKDPLRYSVHCSAFVDKDENGRPAKVFDRTSTWLAPHEQYSKAILSTDQHLSSSHVPSRSFSSAPLFTPPSSSSSSSLETSRDGSAAPETTYDASDVKRTGPRAPNKDESVDNDDDEKESKRRVCKDDDGRDSAAIDMHLGEDDDNDKEREKVVEKAMSPVRKGKGKEKVKGKAKTK